MGEFSVVVIEKIYKYIILSLYTENAYFRTINLNCNEFHSYIWNQINKKVAINQSKSIRNFEPINKHNFPSF